MWSESQGVPKEFTMYLERGNTELFTDICSKGKITVQRKVPSLRARMVIAAYMAKRALSPERV